MSDDTCQHGVAPETCATCISIHIARLRGRPEMDDLIHYWHGKLLDLWSKSVQPGLGGPARNQLFIEFAAEIAEDIRGMGTLQ